MEEKKSSKPRCFLIIPFREEFRRVRDAIYAAARESGVTTSLADEVILQRPIAEFFASEIGRADFVVADISDANANVYYELGLAHAMGKPTLVLKNAAARGFPFIPFDISDVPAITYNDDRAGVVALERQLRRSFNQIRRSPARFRSFKRLGTVVPKFSVDWKRLDPRDFENLCLELLLQLGFQNVEWGKELRGIDAVAVLPKKDPDGHEYRELWLVAMGMQMPIEHAAEMILSDSLPMNERITRIVERETLQADSTEVPTTLLLIPNPLEPMVIPDFEEYVLRRTRRLLLRRQALRVRVWDRQYLTRLVTQYSQVGYKYFSDEVRAVSRYRKTPEEMYQEIAMLNVRLQSTIVTLEQERFMRVRAERDAVWKDLSFTAAHKLGNPIFALETYLGPLTRRIDPTDPEPREILGRMSVSIEEAKSIIQQFKSLTRAQEISPSAISIRELVESACHVADSGGVDVQIDLPTSLPQVSGDPARLSECFNELVANAYHWFDKEERKINVSAEVVATGGKLPEGLGPGRYVCVHFRDNGIGVPTENKERIFDAFFSTYHHGTGLGLSVVRRILEGHGGTIREVGVPGQGADFELYLPVAEEKASRPSNPKKE
jgi:signal transduction histidine kinase